MCRKNCFLVLNEIGGDIFNAGTAAEINAHERTNDFAVLIVIYSLYLDARSINDIVYRWISFYTGFCHNKGQAWFPAETQQGRREFNHPLGAFSWRNGFSLPGVFLLNADLHYMTEGHSENIGLLKDRWWANLTLGKSFLKERLSLQCVVVDVFNILSV